jgi:hypothetical protein
MGRDNLQIEGKYLNTCKLSIKGVIFKIYKELNGRRGEE